MGKISWTDHVRNAEVLRRVKEERNIIHTVKGRRANWIGHVLRRNSFLKHIIKGKIEGRTNVTERQGRRYNQLLDDMKEMRAHWNFKEDAQDLSLCRTRF